MAGSSATALMTGKSGTPILRTMETRSVKYWHSRHRMAPCILLLTMLFCATATGEEAHSSLWESRDAGLQEYLELAVAELGLTKAVAGKRLAIALVDVSDPRAPRVASLNGDRMFYAASLPKLAILYGAMVEMERGVLQPDEPLWADLHRMIRKSDNGAATRVLRRVGRERLLEILQEGKPALYDPAHGGGLWVGKEYGPAPAYRRDPLAGLSHGATAMQVARFYYLLENGRLVNSGLTARMKEILVAPGIHHKFVHHLRKLPDARLYRKSGTWRDFHADSLLVEEGELKYIMVALARDARGGEWLKRLAMPLRQAVLESRRQP